MDRSQTIPQLTCFWRVQDAVFRGLAEKMISASQVMAVRSCCPSKFSNYLSICLCGQINNRRIALTCASLLIIYISMIQKAEKVQHSTQPKCQICHNQSSNSECVLTDVAAYSSQTGNLVMVARLACKNCREEVSTLRQYVEENALAFGKNSTVFRENIEPYLENIDLGKHTAQSQYFSQIYIKTIQQQTKRLKLHHEVKLPQNCLQLVYYSSLSVNHAERHERVRNTIIEIMKLAPVGYNNHEDIAILVHVLSCYMHEDRIVELVHLIAARLVTEAASFPEASKKKDKVLEDDMTGDQFWTQMYDSFYIGNILIIIGEMLRNWKDFSVNFQKLKQFRGYIKSQKLSKLIPVESSIASTYSSPNKKSMIIEDKQATICKQCERAKLQSAYSQIRFKNVLSIICRSLLKQDTMHREHVQQLEIKFVKEKEQFINKIIKLKDKIEVLEQNEGDQQQKTRVRRARSVSDCNIKHIYKPDLEAVSEKSEGTNKTIQIREKNQENAKILETDKSKQNQTIGYLQRLVVNIPQFDPSMLSNEIDQKVLVETIEKSIKNIREQSEKLQKKCRTFENQSKRLLSILTRKQQRFVPLIHEKDEIIQKYQNALWRMEHGMPVEDPALAPRITNIINTFKNEFMQSLSNGTIQSDRNIDEAQIPAATTPVKAKTSKKKIKQKQKIREKTESKIEKGQKQCSIF